MREEVEEQEPAREMIRRWILATRWRDKEIYHDLYAEDYVEDTRRLSDGPSISRQCDHMVKYFHPRVGFSAISDQRHDSIPEPKLRKQQKGHFYVASSQALLP
jgi:hypothetical protein